MRKCHQSEPFRKGLQEDMHNTFFESNGGHSGGEWSCNMVCKDGKGLYGGGLWPNAKLKW